MDGRMGGRIEGRMGKRKNWLLFFVFCFLFVVVLFLFSLVAYLGSFLPTTFCFPSFFSLHVFTKTKTWLIFSCLSVLSIYAS